jgi:hypothetical protein
VVIETRKSYYKHATNPFRTRLYAAGFRIRSVTRAYCESVVRRSIMTETVQFLRIASFYQTSEILQPELNPERPFPTLG